MCLESNGVDRVRSLRKILPRLHGTNFCTTSARFAPSFVRQPKGPKCTQNSTKDTKHEVRVQYSGSSGSLWKIPPRLHGTNFCTTSARFVPSFVRQPNGTKCTQIVRNAPKHEFRSQRGQSGVFVVKNNDTTSCQELLRQFGPFCTDFCTATKRSQMHPNSTNHTKIWV